MLLTNYNLYFHKEGNVSLLMYVSTKHLLFHCYRVTLESQKANKRRNPGAWSMSFECPSPLEELSSSGKELALCFAKGKWQGSGRGKSASLYFCCPAFWELLYLYRAIPWCHDNFLGGQQTTPYWGSVASLSLSPTLLFSIPQLPHGLGIFQQYDKVTLWPFYDS